MSQMGQGILEAGANIGRSIQGGYESMGRGLAGGISSGISAVASAYGDYKKMQSDVKASQKAYETFKNFLDPQTQQQIDSQIESMNKDTTLSLQDKSAFWNQAKTVMGGAINQKFAIDKQQQELNAAAARQAASEAAARDRTVLGAQSQFDIEQLRQKYRAQQSGGVNFGLDPFGGGGPSGGAASYNQQYGK
jgi:hypothetical protein